ncbi:WD40 repeat-like protein [Piedraia hortae CBS 480.64]|uniref:WD40 repeat-like protein n=1 Tax=Piedraia hortae CBS 480.64 TaxID=1314780 RepID=A0A6A7C4X8_9PEZI|nr:WD40 repeat-like protein [Piedraia hortae CBS 480.64]
MNTRKPIQPPNTSVVHALSFSSTRSRFTAALSNGIHCFRSDNCLTTYWPRLPAEGGIGIAEAIDDRYIALVGGGREPAWKPSEVIFWDAVLGKETKRFDMHEPIRGIRISARWLVVLLLKRVLIFRYQKLAGEGLMAPNIIRPIITTGSNYYGLASLSGSILVLPQQACGQAQLISLEKNNLRILKAHQASVRSLALSDDGSLLATASERGTMIRVFHTQTLQLAFEFRRGVDQARIYSLAISPKNRWLACTSDKGTLHIFRLSHEPLTISGRPNSHSNRPASQPTRPPSSQQSSGGRSYASNTQGSVQEYYNLRPATGTSLSPPRLSMGATALGILKKTPFTPRAIRDIRSVFSTEFHIGDDDVYWQGGPSTPIVTEGPEGKKIKAPRPVLPLPNDPLGRPPKGVLGFAKEEGETAVVRVLAGGMDARWEEFEISSEGIVHRGFRRLLTRQFV